MNRFDINFYLKSDRLVTALKEAIYLETFRNKEEFIDCINKRLEHSIFNPFKFCSTELLVLNDSMILNLYSSEFGTTETIILHFYTNQEINCYRLYGSRSVVRFIFKKAPNSPIEIAW